MKTSRFLALVVLTAFPVRAACMDDRPRPVGVDDLMAVRTVTEARISPDGTKVCYVVLEPDEARDSYRSGLWLVGVEGAPPLRLTNGPGRDGSPRWSPDGKKIAFVSDRDGAPRIWAIPVDGGEAEPLTGKSLSPGAFSWSPDGGRIAFLSVDPETEDGMIHPGRPSGMTRLFLFNLRNGETGPLTGGAFSVEAFDWSPDGRRLAFSARPTSGVADLFRSDLFIVPAAGGDPEPLVRRPGVDSAPRWSPDGRRIAFLSTHRRTGWIVNWSLGVVSSGGGEPENASPEFDEFAAGQEWGPDSRTLLFTGNQGVYSRLYEASLETRRTRPLTSGDLSVSDLSFSKKGDRMAFIGTDPSTPPEVFVSTVEPYRPVRLTRTNPGLETLRLGRMEIIRWKSSDGLPLEGLLLMPPDDPGGGRRPLLTYIHGGPSGKFSYTFSPQIGPPYPIQGESFPLHVFAARGFAVFMPNPRGSYGYGEKFRTANVRDWGGGDFRDIMSGIDHLIGLGIADPDALGIMGRSYGGYMTAWAISQTNRFKAASLGAGMSNLASFYGQTDIPGYMEYYLGGVPWESEAEYRKRSPLFFASAIRTPTLIQHGEKDARVPPAQASELAAALRRNKVETEYEIYPGQGHVIMSPRFQRRSLETNLEWFVRRLVKLP